MEIKIGSRGSKLALTQTGHFANRLKELNPTFDIKIIQIRTTGDMKQGTALAAQSDKRDWIHELELAVIDGTIDLAVHSGKDVPALISEKTILLSVLERETPYDVFIGKKSTNGRLKFKDLPAGATVGTASLRRRAQLTLLRPDIKIVDLRGNVPTRLQKLDDSSELSGIILAAAGMNRLGLGEIEREALPSPQFLPAVNQGILAVQLRRDHQELINALRAGILNDRCQVEFTAERACVNLLNADCKSAVAIFAKCEGEQLSLGARVMLPNGTKMIECFLDASASEAEALGTKVAKKLIEQGALQILEESHRF